MPHNFSIHATTHTFDKSGVLEDLEGVSNQLEFLDNVKGLVHMEDDTGGAHTKVELQESAGPSPK